MNDVLINDIDTGSADSSATGDNDVSVSYDDLIVVVNDIKDILTTNFETTETTETITENSIDDIYSVLTDIKSVNTSILLIVIVSVTISVFRKLFDQF